VVPPFRATRQGCRLRNLLKLFWIISQKRDNMSLTSGLGNIG
jgi:hypothetical protein